jgi:hypothetical protein
MNLKLSINRAFSILLALLLLASASVAAGCAYSPTDKSIDDQTNLHLTLRAFHRDMRWLRWESAAMVVAPAQRQQFLGRYQELGDDFHISNLEIKKLTHVDDKVIVDIEQESYMEPAMIVEKERFIEVWEKPTGDWLLTRRMPKDEYEEMKKAEAAQKLAESKEKAASQNEAAADLSAPN